MAIEPVTREERFLAAAGGRSVTPPAPITRKEQLLQDIIDAVKSGGASPDVIEGAVNDYLNANPVQPGATTEQAAQIEKNKTDIADLQTEVDELKESGGNGSGQNPGQDGEDGATFTPAVSTDGTLSWTNDKGLENPAPVNIKGPQGERGLTGETGPTGAAGAPGKDGYTPQKGVDYFDGQPGKDGKDGADGNGIKSATLNADYTLTLTFDDGTTYTTPSIRGATGSTGPAGYTPVKGTDYCTEADKAEMVAAVIAALPDTAGVSY